MAKKPRTPAPPKRPVQAPQRRDRKRGAAGGRNLWPIVAVLVLVAAAAVGAALYFALRGNSSNGTKSTTAAKTKTHKNFNNLPGVRKTKAPWPPEYAHLADRLIPLNLDPLSGEVTTYHIHQHLDIFRNGKKIAVPAFIGINDNSYITELHSHSTDGVIHVEAPSNRHYTLGSFFAEWGVFLNANCVGAYCSGYKWYVNGKLQVGNAADLVLKRHEEIAIVIGKPPKKVPKTYNWQGL